MRERSLMRNTQKAADDQALKDILNTRGQGLPNVMEKSPARCEAF
jgi:hypothetical protein